MTGGPTGSDVRFLIRTVGEVVAIVGLALVFGLAAAVACGGVS